LDGACLIYWNDLLYRIDRRVSVGRRKALAHCASREKKAPVIMGKALTEVALHFSYLCFACSHVRTVALLPCLFRGIMQRRNQPQQV